MYPIDERINKLKNLKILDTEEEEVFDEIVETATDICLTPIGIINLIDIDRQWFKSMKGIDFRETELSVAICTHTLEEPDGLLIINDLSKDTRFRNNPFVTGPPHCRSYAGVCLCTEDGYNIGTLAVFDTVPRTFTERQIFGLQTLAKGTMRLIREKNMKIEFQNHNRLLNTLNKNLESFNYSVAHDVKAPLKHMESFSQLLLENRENDKFKGKEIELLTYIHDNSQKLSQMVDNLLTFSQQVQLDKTDFEEIDSRAILSGLIEELTPLQSSIRFILAENLPTIFTSKIVFERVFHNLLSNAIKYRDTEKESSTIGVSYQLEEEKHIFSIKDNGIGMNPERLSQAFSLFNRDQQEEESYGVGLTIVKELLHKIGGDISLDSTLGIGTTARIEIPVS